MECKELEEFRKEIFRQMMQTLVNSPCTTRDQALEKRILFDEFSNLIKDYESRVKRRDETTYLKAIKKEQANVFDDNLAEMRY